MKDNEKKVRMLTSVSLVTGAFSPKQVVGVCAEVSPLQMEQWVKSGLAEFVGGSVAVTVPELQQPVTVEDVKSNTGPAVVIPAKPVKTKPVKNK